MPVQGGKEVAANQVMPRAGAARGMNFTGQIICNGYAVTKLSRVPWNISDFQGRLPKYSAVIRFSMQFQPQCPDDLENGIETRAAIAG